MVGIQQTVVPGPLRDSSDLPAQRAFRIPRGTPILAFDPQGVLEEMGCFCCRALAPGLVFAALLVPFCTDDLDPCPAFVI